jgi:hypothetical protein
MIYPVEWRRAKASMNSRCCAAEARSSSMVSPLDARQGPGSCVRKTRSTSWNTLLQRRVKTEEGADHPDRDVQLSVHRWLVAE